MRQEVIIPWRPMGCEYRQRHFEYLYDYYSQKYDVIIGDKSDADGNFSRAGARNQGVQESKSDIIVLIDADNFIPYSQIDYAIKAAATRNRLCKPNSYFGYLSEEGTEQLYGGELTPSKLDWLNPPRKKFTGGSYVIKKAAWEKVGGMDEDFIGYGAEDDALHIICNNILGPVVWGVGYNYHMYHPADRHTPRENYDMLIEKYVNVYGDVI